MMELTTGERSMLVNTRVGAIIALALDVEENGQVYWIDIINKRLKVVNAYGTKERRVVVIEGVVEPVGLAVEGMWLYWADRDQAMIVMVDKMTGTQTQLVLSKNRVVKVSQLDDLVSELI